MTRSTHLLRMLLLLALFFSHFLTPLYAQQPSSTRNITLDRPGAKKWALLIGVNKYIHASQLAYCSRDVSVLAERLMSLGFPKQHVYQLHDQAAERKNEPYKSNIDTVLELLLGKLDATGEKLAQAGLVSPGDLVIVAFSGHGVHLDGTSYFCPIDARLDRQRIAAFAGSAVQAAGAFAGEREVAAGGRVPERPSSRRGKDVQDHGFHATVRQFAGISAQGSVGAEQLCGGSAFG